MAGQLLNISVLLILLNLPASNLLPKYMALRFGVFANIYPTFFKFRMSNDDKSKEVSAEQPSNIQYMLVTFEVLKCDTSKEVSLEQPKNILRMSVTSDVLKFDTSKEVSAEQPSNIRYMILTFEVLKFSIPSIVDNFSKS